MEYVQLLKRVDFTIGMLEKQADAVYQVLQNHPNIIRLKTAKPYEMEIMGRKIKKWYLDCRADNDADFQALIDEFEEQKLCITISVR